MNRNQLILFFVLSCVIKTLTGGLKGEPINIPYIFGSGLGLFAMSYIVTLIPKLFYKLLKKEFNNTSFIYTYATMWGFFVLLEFFTIMISSSK